MHSIRLLGALALVVAAFGCAGHSHSPSLSSNGPQLRVGESVVLAGETPAKLAFGPFDVDSFKVRNTYLDGLPQTVHYEAGVDFTIDPDSATIKRMPRSRIPDFRTNILYGQEDFDQTKFPGFGNGPYFVFVDYFSTRGPGWPEQPPQANFLPRTLARIHAGEKISLVAFGDSITAGGEATGPALVYWQHWADWLGQKYPFSKIETINAATGGDTTVNGLARLQEKVLSRHPDLVLIAFGMNDANRPPFGVPVEMFAQNLRVMVDRIRSETQAEIILCSAFPPNPKWHWASGKMEAYALVTEQVAREKQCAYADVYHNWRKLAATKKPEDLLGNNINHPNDFGHGIYFEVLTRLGL
ncbi:MAG: Lipolytic protein family [Pedosphaera sp.]|nr:Lipolytic protein family [Pedosphaera sp.]